MLTYDQLKNQPRKLLTMTGLTRDEFEKLVPAFRAAEIQLSAPDLTLEGKLRRRQAGGGATGKLHHLEDRLLFILVYQKTYTLQTVVGLHLDLSQPQAHYWIHRLFPVLERALAQQGYLPERQGDQVAGSLSGNASVSDLRMDATERRRQRPKDAEQQTEHYSGKKKSHTDKNLLVVHAQTEQVVYLGPTTPGTKQDKKMADEAAITYPPGTTLGKDTGFQGYEPHGVVTYQPKKNRKANR
jgi:hypothetical protein